MSKWFSTYFFGFGKTDRRLRKAFSDIDYLKERGVSHLYRHTVKYSWIDDTAGSSLLATVTVYSPTDFDISSSDPDDLPSIWNNLTSGAVSTSGIESTGGNAVLMFSPHKSTLTHLYDGITVLTDDGQSYTIFKSDAFDDITITDTVSTVL